MKESGKIWLAGAGPGDAALLTVKTRQLLEEADVVVYDALISAEILSLIPPGTKTVHVGKRAGHHCVSQKEINQILVEEAEQGRKVLRLKGGDPFVFGRGGEELERIVAEGIPFEVVPGVTSALSVPAYGGIPVTHRDYASSVHVITGHTKEGGSLKIDFAALVKMNATLVFLMGLSALPHICEGLLQAGMDPQMPAAVLSRGTTAKQEMVLSTVERIDKDTKEKDMHPPAVIVVGRVCSLAPRFEWTKKRPLGGKQILVTRPRQHLSKLAGELRSLGAQVIELPSIVTHPIHPNQNLCDAMDRLGKGSTEEWFVFTSPVGVTLFFEELYKMKRDIRTLFRCSTEIKAAAIGRATANALAEHGIFADVIPEVYCGKNLGTDLAKQAPRGSHITILRAKDGSEELLPPLYEAGLNVTDVAIYETCAQSHPEIREKIRQLFLENAIDYVTFTSASTVEGFVRTMAGMDFTKIHAVCIGEQTAKAAKRYDMQIQISKTASIESMIQLLLDQA